MENRRNIKDNGKVVCKLRQGRKKYNLQLAIAYIAYMMIGSHYLKCEISNKIIEERLKFEYMKMPVSDQYIVEDLILGWMNEDVHFEECSDLRCKVYAWSDGKYIMNFETFFGLLTIEIASNGEVAYRFQ